MVPIDLAHQPGTVWEYSLASDLLGRVVEAASGERLADFLDRRLFRPLKMNDTAFWVPKEKIGRLAEPLAADAATGKASNLMDVSAVPANDSGGAGGVSTAADYLRFSQMLLNGGQLDGVRVLSRSSVTLMVSDHLGTRIAALPGSAGEFMWGGYAGTYFWVDPKEEIVAVYMVQAPGPLRPYYRRLFKQLVYAAIND